MDHTSSRDTGTDRPGHPDAPGSRSRAMPQWVYWLKLIVFDIAGPLLVYRYAQDAGISQVVSLVLSGIPPLIGILIEFVWKRRVEIIGVFVIAGIALGAVLALFTGDPRLYLLEGAAKSAVMGLVVIGSALLGKPAVLYFWRAAVGGPDAPQGRWIDENNAAKPEVRRLFRNGTYLLGGLTIVTAVLGGIIAYTASTEFALAWNRLDFIPSVVIFTSGWIWMTRRAHARGDLDFDTMPSNRTGRSRADAEREANGERATDVSADRVSETDARH